VFTVHTFNAESSDNFDNEDTRVW